MGPRHRGVGYSAPAPLIGKGGVAGSSPRRPRLVSGGPGPGQGSAVPAPEVMPAQDVHQLSQVAFRLPSQGPSCRRAATNHSCNCPEGRLAWRVGHPTEESQRTVQQADPCCVPPVNLGQRKGPERHREDLPMVLRRRSRPETEAASKQLGTSHGRACLPEASGGPSPAFEVGFGVRIAMQRSQRWDPNSPSVHPNSVG